MRYGIREAKNKLAAVVREAEEGRPIVLTRNGKAVVVMLPMTKSVAELGDELDMLFDLVGPIPEGGAWKWGGSEEGAEAERQNDETEDYLESMETMGGDR